MNFSCSSPAAAAVCTSIDRRSMVRPTIVGRSIDRHLRTKPLGHLPKPKARPTSLHQRPSTARASTSTCNLTSPANSSRYLLDGESTIFDVHTDIEPEIDLFDKLKIRTAGRSSIHTSTPCRLLKPMKENETSSTLVRSAPSTARAHHGHVWAQSKSDRSHHDQVWFSFPSSFFFSVEMAVLIEILSLLLGCYSQYRLPKASSIFGRR